ncbi:MAG: hypothetical protein Q4D39_00145, partial [Coriobacteriaceae bacterium]|nr:hypothetical protein [Coriobacteriaceae bacterium]
MLTAIEELYKQIYAKLKPLSDSYESLMSGVASTTEADLAALEARKANLAEQLEKIEDYREQVEAYIMTAEKVLKSRNHSTIVPRELNFNKLRNWSMMIGSADPDDNGDDPYARRIHYLCLCNRLYLDQKQQEFEH